MSDKSKDSFRQIVVDIVGENAQKLNHESLRELLRTSCRKMLGEELSTDPDLGRIFVPPDTEEEKQLQACLSSFIKKVVETVNQLDKLPGRKCDLQVHGPAITVGKVMGLRMNVSSASGQQNQKPPSTPMSSSSNLPSHTNLYLRKPGIMISSDKTIRFMCEIKTDEGDMLEEAESQLFALALPLD